MTGLSRIVILTILRTDQCAEFPGNPKIDYTSKNKNPAGQLANHPGKTDLTPKDIQILYANQSNHNPGCKQGIENNFFFHLLNLIISEDIPFHTF